MQEAQDRHFNVKMEQEIEKVMAAIEKTQDNMKGRVATVEAYTVDKIELMKQEVRYCERLIANMATTAMLDKMQEDNKALKAKFTEEFDQFQIFFKDQNTRFQAFNTKIRKFEAQLKGYGDSASLNNMLEDYTGNKFVKIDQLDNLKLGGKFGKTSSSMTPSGDGVLTPNMKKAMQSQASAPGDSKLKGIEMNYQQFEEMEERLLGMQELIESKIDKNTVENMIESKVSKSELVELLPDQEALDKKFASMCEEQADVIWLKLEEKLVVWDQRLLNIRQEFDRNEINRLIDTKANGEQVSNDFNNHEFKIAMLDKNIIAIASDFETFQNAINRMNSVVLELQDINKDVLVGKRNLNCLSCGNKDPGQHAVVHGKDGRVNRAANS